MTDLMQKAVEAAVNAHDHWWATDSNYPKRVSEWDKNVAIDPHHYDKLAMTAALEAALRVLSAEAIAWSVLDVRTGRHWYTSESKFASQYHANLYSHREADGDPSMKVVPLFLAPQPASGGEKDGRP